MTAAEQRREQRAAEQRERIRAWAREQAALAPRLGPQQQRRLRAVLLPPRPIKRPA